MNRETGRYRAAIARAAFALTVWLGASSPAFAGLATVDVETSLPDQETLLKLPIYDRAACEAALNPILAPEKVIAAGLRAIRDPGNEAGSLACVSELLTHFPELAGSIPEPPVDFIESIGNPRRRALIEESRQLSIQLGCVNIYPPGTPEFKEYAQDRAHCTGRWLSREEEKRLRILSDQNQEALQMLDGEQSLRTDAFRDLVKFLEPGLAYPELEPLRAGLECRAKAVPGDLPKSCGGKSLSPEEADLRQKRYLDAWIAARAANHELENAATVVQDLARSPNASDYIDPKAVLDIYTRAHCREDVPEFVTAKDSALFCKSLNLPAGETPAQVRMGYRKLVKDLRSFAKKVAVKEKARLNANEALRKSLRAAAPAQYGLRHLLTAYEFLQRQRGDALSVKEFCLANEAREQDNASYGKEIPLYPFRTEEQWRLARQYGLSEAELTALTSYTAINYRDYNEYLWDKAAKKPRSEPLIEYSISLLTKGLHKLPAYGEKPVQRYTKLPAEVLAQHQPGALLTYEAFTSTSKKEKWNWSGGQRFLIYGQNGRLVEAVSDKPQEEEVLFPAGTRFKVLSRTDDPETGTADIVMAEVDENGVVIGKIPAPLL